MTRLPPGPRSAFTLIELLVVIAIIAILIALLVPAVQRVREAAARIQCANNLKQVALAVHAYHDTNRALPQSFGFSYNANSRDWSWIALTLPYLEQAPLHRQMGIPTSRINVRLADDTLGCAQRIEVLRCPSDPDYGTAARTDRTNVGGTLLGLTNYKGVSGANWRWGDPRWNSVHTGDGNCDGLDRGNGCFFRSDGTPTNPCRRKLALLHIRDGTSNTFLVGETLVDKDQQASWAFANHATGTCAIHPNSRKPDGGEYDGTDWPNVYSFRSAHPGGLQFALADGSVRFVLDTVGIPTYRAMATVRGGEPLTLSD